MGPPRDLRTNHTVFHGRCVEDIELGSWIVFGKQRTEHNPAPIPYQEPNMPQVLHFGFYISGACLPLLRYYLSSLFDKASELLAPSPVRFGGWYLPQPIRCFNMRAVVSLSFQILLPKMN